MTTRNTAVALQGEALLKLPLPPANAYVIPGVRWGRPETLFSPAFWRTQAWYRELHGGIDDFRIGRSLAEEVAACLLGGYGMPAELGLAAFHRLQAYGLLSGPPWPGEDVFVSILSEPFLGPDGPRRYRFPNQRGIRVARALAALDLNPPPVEDPLAFRESLLRIPGIGFKTASWIARNHLGAQCFAILDIHIMRAGFLLGLWHRDAAPGREYRSLETTFVHFAKAIGITAGILDAVMWDVMRELGRVALDALRDNRQSGSQ